MAHVDSTFFPTAQGIGCIAVRLFSMNPFGYADDLQLHSSNRTDQDVDGTVQDGMDTLEDTCREKRMIPLSSTRSHDFRRTDPTSERDETLGSAGSASSHVKYLTTKTRNIVNNLRRLQMFPTLAAVAYTCMLVPSVTYASAAWSASLTNDQLKQIRRIQDNALQSMLGLPLWISSRYARAEVVE